MSAINFRDIDRLLLHYSSHIPRYTSYPTAVELKEPENLKDVHAAVGSAGSLKDLLSLYVHLPFCESLCYFCACNKIITQDATRIDNYLDYLTSESNLFNDICPARVQLGQIHLGGGSPSYLSVEQFFRLEEIMQNGFDLSRCTHKSIEIDPRTCSQAKLEAIKELGYNRISLGVQDFDPAVQELIHRIQSYELVRDHVAALRNLGLKSINFDLIYGLPGQNPDSFSKTMGQVLTLEPTRIALYGYAHVQWKVKVQKVFDKYPLPTPQERIKLFSKAVEMLTGHGYEYIGLDHFALPGDELTAARRQKRLRRNFMGYTTIEGAGIAALGISSISDLCGTMYQNHTVEKPYQEAINEGRLPVKKTLVRSMEDSIRAFIIERLMCLGEISRTEVQSVFSNSDLVETIFSDGLSRMIQLQRDGLVSLERDAVTVTPLGQFFLRNIAASFDAYLKAPVGSEKRRFSQSV